MFGVGAVLWTTAGAIVVVIAWNILLRLTNSCICY
jgi:hypothetical protein